MPIPWPHLHLVFALFNFLYPTWRDLIKKNLHAPSARPTNDYFQHLSPRRDYYFCAWTSLFVYSIAIRRCIRSFFSLPLFLRPLHVCCTNFHFFFLEPREQILLQMSTCVVFTSIFSANDTSTSTVFFFSEKIAGAFVSAMPFNEIEEQKHGNRTKINQFGHTVGDSSSEPRDKKRAKKIIIALPLVVFGSFEHKPILVSPQCRRHRSHQLHHYHRHFRQRARNEVSNEKYPNRNWQPHGRMVSVYVSAQHTIHIKTTEKIHKLVLELVSFRYLCVWQRRGEKSAVHAPENIHIFSLFARLRAPPLCTLFFLWFKF